MPDDESKSASNFADSTPPEPPNDDVVLARATVPPALHDKQQRAAWKLPTDDTKPGSYMVELNLLYSGGISKAAEAFKELYRQVIGPDADGSRAPPGLRPGAHISHGLFPAFSFKIR